MTCKSGVPTLDGSRSLFINKSTYVTFNRLRDVLMLLETLTKRDKASESTTDIMVLTKDGRSSILIRRQRLRLRD
jgi:hypothetical protein